MIDAVEKSVCEFFHVSMQDLYSPSTKNIESEARAYLMYILHFDFKLSASRIAKRYNRADRSVKYAIAKMRYLVDNDTGTKRKYMKIKKNIPC